jgi:hypothetical protein
MVNGRASRRERDDPAHPGPGDHRYRPRRGGGVSLAHPAARPPWNVGGGKDPHEAHEYDGQANESGVQDEGGDGVIRLGQPLDDVAELQPDEAEDQAVEQEADQLPERITLKTCLGRDDVGTSPPQVETRSHDRQHPGEGELSGESELLPRVVRRLFR